jgi:N-acetylglucosamine kinase-like BadF-type ATPase
MEGRAGGLGYLMGDEGSAWWIGIKALQAAAAAADGRGPETVLLPFVLEHFGVPTIRHLHGVLYAPSFERTMVSGLTVQIARLAGTDAVARGIMTAAGEKLAAMAIATIRQIYTSGEPVDVYPTGGVFRAGDVVIRPFEAWLRAQWSTATVRQPGFEPMYGALIRAYQAAGIEVSAGLLGNLRA